jgi:hypothetical protein
MWTNRAQSGICEGFSRLLVVFGCYKITENRYWRKDSYPKVVSKGLSYIWEKRGFFLLGCLLGVCRNVVSIYNGGRGRSPFFRH